MKFNVSGIFMLQVQARAALEADSAGHKLPNVGAGRLYKVRNLGAKSRKEVRDVLASYGLTLKYARSEVSEND